MIPGKIIAGLLGAFAGALCFASAASANSLGSVEGMPFFGRPYPYGFVYHRAPSECYEIRPVDTPDGPKLMETWICDAPVSARY
ncbi:hypothetical protein SAMN05444581_11817 [Methylocapsa palsarum]|uniref:Uncharacterized protein n=1 Tax=Methylocapsa palsarum TaxID=1612308 RepID=A0A1I4C308_9HYPH|nr:hypothetical protein SAMN05444581_11817 [Methylocapsa palsarum]